MKKVMILLAASLIFAACGGSSEQVAQDSTKVDSAAVVVDSLATAPAAVADSVPADK